MEESDIRENIAQRKAAEASGREFQQAAEAVLAAADSPFVKGFWIAVLDWLSCEGACRPVIERQYSAICAEIDRVVQDAHAAHGNNWLWQDRYRDFAVAVGEDPQRGNAVNFQSAVRAVVTEKKYNQRAYVKNRTPIIWAICGYFGQRRTILAGEEEMAGAAAAEKLLNQMTASISLNARGRGELSRFVRQLADQGQTVAV